jgi:ankyrin repeat protein
MKTSPKALHDWDVIFERDGAKALIDQCRLNADQLNEFMIYRASGGGTGWPTELYKVGADPNFVDDEGSSALSQCVHVAAFSKGQKIETFETAMELLSIGANPNQLYSTFCSITSLAMTSNRPEFVALFLLAGAELDRIEPDEGRPLRDILGESQHKWASHLLEVVAARAKPAAC